MDPGALLPDITGERDRFARLAKLREFFSSWSLTDEERRYIMIILSSVKIDIISELPVELVRQIADLLDLHHFIACLAVSRKWREKLKSPLILRTVTNKFYPSLIQPGDTQEDPDKCLKGLQKIGRARWGYFQSHFSKPFSWKHESYFMPDPDYHGNDGEASAIYSQLSHYQDDPEPDSQAYLHTLYSHGRIAWCAKQRMVVVDNLWLRTRKVFTVPTGPLISPILQILALGDRLVVGAMDRVLIAWDHGTNVRLQKKLPGPIRHVATSGSRVVIILFDGDAFLWEFGGKLSTIPTASLKEYHGLNGKPLKRWASNLRVIFHPSCQRTFFLASGYTECTSSGTVLKRAVYEYKDTCHIETFEFGISPKVHNRTDPANVKVEIRKVLPYRRDIIGFCEQYYRPNLQTLTPYQFETFVEFDIYDRRFTARTGEEFNYSDFGWRIPLEDSDLDFLIKFHSNGFSATSYSPEFDFKVGAGITSQ